MSTYTFCRHVAARRQVQRISIIFALVITLAAISAAEDAPSGIPVKALFSNPAFSHLRLSTDGQRLAYVQSQNNLHVLVTKAVNDGDPVPIGMLDDPGTRVHWLEWANDKRLLVCLDSKDPVAIGVRGRRTRLLGVDHDGKNFDWLGKRLPVYDQDNIIHWMPEDSDGILMQVWPSGKAWPYVVRLDVRTGAQRTFHKSSHSIQRWFVDPNGNVRAGIAVKEKKFSELWARSGTTEEFQLAIRQELANPYAEFLGFHADDPSRIYVRSEIDGRSAVFEFSLKDTKLDKLVYSHSEFDIDGLIFSLTGDNEAIGVTYTADSQRIHFFDEDLAQEYEMLMSELSRALGQAVSVLPISGSADGTREILRVSSDTQPPRFYLFDRTLGKLTLIFDERPEVDRSLLAPTYRITYQARDGLSIPAYLTIPRGRRPEDLPLIVLVHGGPWARDWIGWNPEVQLFASRGFAVLQPNFRGSAGFGTQHLVAGYREWGEKIQDDITDGVLWLIAEGVADADRVGITGTSFGGYAALMGLIKTPELYRAGAAYAPVTDIEQLLDDDSWYNWGYEWHETLIGGDKGDKDRLRQNSPVRNVEGIRVPLLLGHGEQDQRIHVKQSRRLAKAMRNVDIEFDYLEFPDEIHGFAVEASRIGWYENLIAFFERNLALRTAVDSPATDN